MKATMEPMDFSAKQSNVRPNPRQLVTLLNTVLRRLEEKDMEKSFQTLPIPDAPWAENYLRVIERPVDLSTIRVSEWEKGEV